MSPEPTDAQIGTVPTAYPKITVLPASGLPFWSESLPVTYTVEPTLEDEAFTVMVMKLGRRVGDGDEVGGGVPLGDRVGEGV